MIRATELMPGDIVQHHGEILKLYMFSRKYAYFGEGHPLNGILLDEVEPVPLTPEILEKNGWSLWEIEGEYKQMDIIPIYGRKAPFSVFDGVEINYVHELQHALRLCGIETEIEL